METTPKALNPELIQGQIPEAVHEPDFMNSDSLPLNGVEAIALQGRTLQSVNEPDFELQGRTLQSGEQDGGFSFREKVEKVKGKLAVLAIGAAGLGFGGMATASASGSGSGEQVGSGVEISNANTGNEAEAPLGPNALRKMCKAEILKKPTMPKSYNELYIASRRDNFFQYWGVAAANWAVPAKCNGKYRRFQWANMEVQDLKRRKLWHAVDPPYIGFLLNRDNKGVLTDDKNNPNYDDGDIDAIISNVKAPSNTKNKNQLYRCTPGPAKTGARSRITTRVRDVKKGKFIGQKVWRFPIRVNHPC